MSSGRSSSKRRRSTDIRSATSKSRKSTTAYDRGFEQNLIDHGVYLDNRAQTPVNWEEINKRLANPRPSLSPSKFSEGAFRAFQMSDFRAKDEDDVMINVVPVISGVDQDNNFSARNTQFGNLKPLTDGTIAAPQPDLYYGARPEQLDRQIRKELSGYIVPSTMEDKPMAPNFYLEAKGPDGSLAVARRQACHGGASGERAFSRLQSYRKKELIYDNNAHTITSIYHGGQLKMYTTHITAPAGPGKLPEYHMTQLRSFALTDTIDTFRQGAAAFRNGRDLTKEWRDNVIIAANERVGSQNAESSSVQSSNYSHPSDNPDTNVPEESDTSDDELALTSFSHPAREPETSVDELVFTSFSHPVEDDISADELDHTIYIKPTASKRRLGTGSEKTVSKDLRHSTTKPIQGRYSKK